MNKKLIMMVMALFCVCLTSCRNDSGIEKSYSYVNPSDIEQNHLYSIDLISNEHLEITIDKSSVIKGEYVNVSIEDIEVGYKFLGWYINDVYRGDNLYLKLQIFENTKIEARVEKTSQVSRVGFSVGGQMIRQVYTDYSLTLKQEVFESVLSSVSYIPYGYEIIGWQDKNGNEYKEGDTITETITLYPIYEITDYISSLRYIVNVEGGEAINADTFKIVEGQYIPMGTIVTFTAYDENGEVDDSKVWIDENDEVYSYKPSFTLTVVKDLNLRTIDKSMVDTSLPIIQSGKIIVERYMADSNFEYVDLRLYSRVIIPTTFQYYRSILDYGAKLERRLYTSNAGKPVTQIQRATFSLKRSQWNLNGEAWCYALDQDAEYEYYGSGFIEFKDIAEQELIPGTGLYVEKDNCVYNRSNWKEAELIVIS